MANVKFTISIPSKDSELIQFIGEIRKNNGLSAYIRELIRNDMENGQPHDIEEIYQYVEKRLRERGFALKETAEGQMKEIIDEVDKEVILNLF